MHTPEQVRVYRVTMAIDKLREARNLLANAGAPRAAERVRAALRSAEGAKRNAECKENREKKFALHLIASKPSHGDGHFNPDETAREIGRYVTRAEAEKDGRAYMRLHPMAWVQVQPIDNSQDGEDVTP